MNRIITYITAIAALSAALASCSREPFDLEGGVRPVVEAKPGDLAFNAFLSAGPATRSDYDTYKLEVPSTGETITLEGFRLPMSAGSMSAAPETRGLPVDDMYSSFAFSALPYEGKEAVRNSQGIYTVEGLRYSDFEDVAKFVCWAPKAAEGVTYDPASRTLRYDAPTDIPTQPDLVVANPAEARPDREEPVELTFYHALAGVAFQTSSLDDELMTIFPDCTVTSLVLKGVYASGVFDPMTKTWTVDESSKTDLPLLQSNVSATSGSTLTGGEYTALLVPQELPSGAELELKLSYQGRSGNEPKTFTYTYPMGGQYLEMGTIYTFSLNGRSMFLFEGTATGPFDVEDVWYEGHSDSRPYFDVTEDMIDPETGKFSVLLPYPPSGHVCFGNANPRRGAQATLQGPEINNYALTTITRLPDWLWRQSPHARSFMFSGCVALERIEADLSFTHTLTSFYGFFSNCTALKEFPPIYTENGTRFDLMFEYCTQLETMPYNLDMRKATVTHGMFSNCTNLKSIYPLTTTTALRDASTMFYECRSLVDVPLFDTSNVTSMLQMFDNCRSLERIPAFDTGNNQNFNRMFYQCYSLKEYSTLDTKNGTTFRAMFQSCGSLPELKLTDTSKGTTFYAFCWGATSIKTIPAHFDFSEAVELNSAFRECASLETVPSFSFPKATKMEYMFYKCQKLRTIGAMDTPVIQSLSGTFHECNSLEESPLRNTGTATNMDNTFRMVGSSVSSGAIWHELDFSNVTTMKSVLYRANFKVIDQYINSNKAVYFWLDNYGQQGQLCPWTVTFGGMDCTSVDPSQYYNVYSGMVNHGPMDGMRASIYLERAVNLTHESLMNIINSIADITATATENPKTLKLGTVNAAKLTADEIAVATTKGWTVVTTD